MPPVREVWEETGLHVAPTRILGLYGGPECHVRYRNGDEVSYLMVVFEARVIGGHPRPDGVEYPRDSLGRAGRARGVAHGAVDAASARRRARRSRPDSLRRAHLGAPRP